MQFSRVVEVYDKIEATTKRLEMTDLLVGLLRGTPKEELDKVVYLTQGRIHPDYEGIELGLAEKMVIRVLAHATGLEDTRVARMWKEKGDLGLVAEEAIGARRQKPLETTPLTIAKVYENLDAIARETGEGSQDRKIRLLSDLLGNATPREAKYIVRMVVGQMRLGGSTRLRRHLRRNRIGTASSGRTTSRRTSVRSRASSHPPASRASRRST